MNDELSIPEVDLSHLNDAQKRIVAIQWRRHQHETHSVDYDVSGEGDVLKGFLVNKGVWDPFLASGRYHARYLFYNNHLFRGKKAIEIGCGTGLMGLVMNKYGANRVLMSDISPLAVSNTYQNAVQQMAIERVGIVRGDLFENVHEKADLITWMIPFFPASSEFPKGDTISPSMMMPQELFDRFLDEAPRYLNAGGVVLLPSYSLGGDKTNPAIQGKRYGYKVETTWAHDSTNGIQQGMLHMHELRRRR